MISVWIREQRRYSQEELCGLLHMREYEIVPLLRRLKEFGIVKAVSSSAPQVELSDLSDENAEIADVVPGDTDYYYVFAFVGIIAIAGRVLKCYPKYLLHSDEPKEELKQVLKVIEKSNTREQIIRMFNESDMDRSFNRLAVILYLLDDYYENGLYSSTEEIVESNGTGEILWDRTINESFALISENRPYYTDLKTRKTRTDEYSYFRKLHACVLTKASEELSDADLLDLFDIEGVELSDAEQEDFGDDDYILYRIGNELNVQFSTRKQLVLKTMYAYIAHRGNMDDPEALSLIGSGSFNLIWEDVCADILDNQLVASLGTLHLPSKLKPGYDPRMRLIDLIEKPYWSSTGRTASDTMIPDLIAIRGDQFIIFDAKYYNARLEPGKDPQGQPGIESIMKQYLYQLAYQKFIDVHGFKKIKNCFLLPTEKDYIINDGEVSMEIFSAQGLQNIEVRRIPAMIAYAYYLSGRKMDIEDLAL